MATQAVPAYRAAREEDFPQIAQLWIEMFEAVGNYSEAQFHAGWRERFVEYAWRRSCENELRYFVVESDGEIVASAGALIQDGYPLVIHGIRTGLIFGVSVRPRFRKRGIATELTKACIDWLKTTGVARIRLHASPFGRPIYERLGFLPTNEMYLP